MKPAGAALAALLLATGARASTPRDLAAALASLRQEHTLELRRAVLGGAEELRDAVAAVSGPEKRRLADRLPGMSVEPFGVCRRLADCRQAPLSLHVEDHALADDAFLALARPWFELQNARGKAVKIVVDGGAGVRLELEDLPALPVVTLSASPAPTGGFDVALEEPEKAAAAFAAERAAVLSAPAR